MKSDFLEELKRVDNYTFTENGAVALKSTGNKMLDAFGSLAAMKDYSESLILNTFYRAFKEDPKMAMRLLFYVRDIRGGQGMRRVFRIIVRSLANTHPELIINNFENFLFFGRGDDLLVLMDTKVETDAINFMKSVLQDDMLAVAENKPVTLLAKWMPSENASSVTTKQWAKKIIKAFKISPKSYRLMLSTLRQHIGIIETDMSQNRWDKINFETVPSRASIIYSDAFMKHVKENYTKYLNDLTEGRVKVNAGALFPVDIIHKVISANTNCWNYGTAARNLKLTEKYLYNAMWKALPNYFEGKEETGICVVDTSGSMSGTPMEVALSLGIYCADKCKGPFKNHFITFSENPELQELQGDNLCDKMVNINYDAWDMNTNIEKVFDLILDTAVNANLAQEDLPDKLYIISDMQFDACICDCDSSPRSYSNRKKAQGTFMSTMEQRYIENGYTMPAIVFWNVRASECGMFQKQFGDKNCCMVSGYSPSLFKSVIEGTKYIEEVNEKGEKVIKQKLDPIVIMTNTLMDERYNRVYVG